jgi:hypothetical protein
VVPVVFLKLRKELEMSTIKYPHITVPIVGEDGNAFSICSRIQRAMKKAGVPQNEIKDFVDEAMSGTYDHFLEVVLKTVATK